MSRLDVFIARVLAQKFLLDRACAEVRSRFGPQDGFAIELGLGNGRTYHHMREHLPGFRVIAFDRELASHPDSRPPEGDFLLGEIDETGPEFARTVGARGLLLHTDVGSHSVAYNKEIEGWLPNIVAPLLQPGGIAISSMRLLHDDLVEEPLPPDAPRYEYYWYRRRRTGSDAWPGRRVHSAA